MKILDLHFQGHAHAIASFLFETKEGPVLLETGPASTLERLEAALMEHGHSLKDVKHALVTHIHLDHSGAAGHLAQKGATIYVHHKGAPHIVDPSRLLESAGRIYKGMMDRLWGDTVPAPKDRVRALEDGAKIEIGDHTFTALDTPGHAGHHMTWVYQDTAFTGDVGGVRLQGERFLSLPAPPPEFDLEKWQQSLKRLRGVKPARLCPTHFGCFEDVEEHLDRLEEIMLGSTELVQSLMKRGHDRDRILTEYTRFNRERARQDGVLDQVWEAYEKANPLFMSVDGLMRYWRKRAPLS